MAPHSSTVARKIPWMEEPGGLQSMGSLRVGHDWATSLSLFTFMHWRRKWQPAPVFLPGESHGRISLKGCSPWGCTESDTTEATLVVAWVFLAKKCSLLLVHRGFVSLIPSLWGQMSFSGKEPTCQCRRHGFNPWRRAWQPTPVFLPGESHVLRSLVGYSPCGRKELDMTVMEPRGKQLPLLFSLFLCWVWTFRELFLDRSGIISLFWEFYHCPLDPHISSPHSPLPSHLTLVGVALLGGEDPHHHVFLELWGEFEVTKENCLF